MFDRRKANEIFLKVLSDKSKPIPNRYYDKDEGEIKIIAIGRGGMPIEDDYKILNPFIGVSAVFSEKRKEICYNIRW